MKTKRETGQSSFTPLAPAQVTTIESHVLMQQRAYPQATGDLTGFLYDIALAAKISSHAMTRAGLIDVLGATGLKNIQGEQVAKLDVLSNETFIRFNSFDGRLAAMASEECADIISIPAGYPLGQVCSVVRSVGRFFAYRLYDKRRDHFWHLPATGRL